MESLGRRPIHTPRQWVAFVLVLGGVAVVLPLLNLAVDESSPWHLPDYLIPLFGKYLCFAMVALAIDLIWGFTGILSLATALFLPLVVIPWACT